MGFYDWNCNSVFVSKNNRVVMSGMWHNHFVCETFLSGFPWSISGKSIFIYNRSSSDYCHFLSAKKEFARLSKNFDSIYHLFMFLGLFKKLVLILSIIKVRDLK